MSHRIGELVCVIDVLMATRVTARVTARVATTATALTRLVALVCLLDLARSRVGLVRILLEFKCDRALALPLVLCNRLDQILLGRVKPRYVALHPRPVAGVLLEVLSQTYYGSPCVVILGLGRLDGVRRVCPRIV